MDDAVLMGLAEGFGGLQSDVEGLSEIERAAANLFGDGGAIDKGHGDEGLALHLVDFVNGGDVGVVQAGRGASFLQKASAILLAVERSQRQKLERDHALQAGVFRPINDTHASLGELRDHVVVRNIAAGHRTAVIPGVEARYPPISIYSLVQCVGRCGSYEVTGGHHVPAFVEERTRRHGGLAGGAYSGMRS